MSNKKEQQREKDRKAENILRDSERDQKELTVENAKLKKELNKLKLQGSRDRKKANDMLESSKNRVNALKQADKKEVHGLINNAKLAKEKAAKLKTDLVELRTAAKAEILKKTKEIDTLNSQVAALQNELAKAKKALKTKATKGAKKK